MKIDAEVRKPLVRAEDIKAGETFAVYVDNELQAYMMAYKSKTHGFRAVRLATGKIVSIAADDMVVPVSLKVVNDNG